MPRRNPPTTTTADPAPEHPAPTSTSRWDRLTLLALAFLSSVLLVRAAVAAISGFGSFHGLNEAVYTMQGASFLDDPLRSRVRGLPYHDTPPMAGYMIALSISAFGNHELAARLPSIVAEAFAIAAVWRLGTNLYDPATGRRAALIFAVMPWNLLWFGRAMSDPYLVAMLSWSFAFLTDRRNPDRGLALGCVFLGLSFLAKQTTLIAGPLVAIYLWRKPFAMWAKAAGWFALGAIPIAAWYAWSWSIDAAFLLESGNLHLGKRSPPFANIPNNLAFGLLLGASPFVLLLAGWQAKRERRPLRNLCVQWFLIFFAFCMWRAPIHHEYYMLVLTPPLAVLAGAALPDAASRLLKAWATREQSGVAALGLVLGAGALGGILLLGIAGDLGNDSVRESARDARMFIRDHPEANVSVPWGHEMKFAYYLDRVEPGLSERVSENRSLDARQSATLVITRNEPRPDYCTDCVLRQFQVYGFGLYDEEFRSFERVARP